MATTPTNRVTRTISEKSVFMDATQVIPSSLSYNQGDLLAFDSSSHIVKLMSAESDASTFLGVAVNTVVSGKLKSPYTGTAVDAVSGDNCIQGPVFGDIVKLQLKNGDSLNPGDYVYADPSTGNANVQATGTKPIGVYQGATVTAGTLTYIELYLGARFPNDVLKF